MIKSKRRDNLNTTGENSRNKSNGTELIILSNKNQGTSNFAFLCGMGLSVMIHFAVLSWMSNDFRDSEDRRNTKSRPVSFEIVDTPDVIAKAPPPPPPRPVDPVAGAKPAPVAPQPRRIERKKRQPEEPPQIAALSTQPSEGGEMLTAMPGSATSNDIPIRTILSVGPPPPPPPTQSDTSTDVDPSAPSSTVPAFKNAMPTINSKQAEEALAGSKPSFLPGDLSPSARRAREEKDPNEVRQELGMPDPSQGFGHFSLYSPDDFHEEMAEARKKGERRKQEYELHKNFNRGYGVICNTGNGWFLCKKADIRACNKIYRDLCRYAEKKDLDKLRGDRQF